jgi:hypothetical protein
VPQLATAEDLAARLGGLELTATDIERADTLLTTASGLVEAAARMPLALVTDDVLTIRGSRESRILLPGRPVVAVTAVTLDGAAVTGGWHVADDELVRPGGWGCERDALVITYTHGHDPIPDAIKAIVLELAARVWTNPGGVISQRLGQAQVTYAVGPTTGMLLTPDERRAVRHLVSRGARSLPIY